MGFIRRAGFNMSSAASSEAPTSLSSAILLYRFDEGSGTTLTNHGTLAPDGTATAGAITWNAQGAVISTSAGVDAITTQNLTAGTVFCAFKLPTSSTADQGLFADTGNDFDLMLRSSPGTPRFKFGAISAVASFGQPNDGLWHILEGTYDGTTVRLLVDGFPLKETAASSLTATLSNLVIGALNHGGGISAATIGYLAVYEQALSPSQRQSLRTQIRSIMVNRGAAFAAVKDGILYEGDSITASANLSAMTIWGNTSMYAKNFAVGGSTIEHDFGGNATMRERIQDVADAINACDRVSLFIMVGANDLITIGTSAYMAQLQDYCDDLRAMVDVPLDIYVKRPTARSDSGFNTLRDALGPLLAAAEGTFFQVYIDTQADPLMGPNSAGSDTEWFSDGTHTTPAGDLRVLRNDKAAWKIRNGIASTAADFNPAHWMDAQDTSTILDASLGSISNGEEVGRWTNKGSSAIAGIHPEKPSGVPAPVYNSSGVNGHPTVQATATGQILVHSYIPPTNMRQCVFLVVSTKGGQTGDRLMYSSHDSFDSRGYDVFSRAGGNNWGVFGGGFETSGVDIQGAGLRVLFWNRAGGAGDMWTNSVKGASASGSHGSTPGCICGQLSQTTLGHYCELGAIEDTLTPNEVIGLSASLLAKWSPEDGSTPPDPGLTGSPLFAYNAADYDTDTHSIPNEFAATAPYKHVIRMGQAAFDAGRFSGSGCTVTAVPDSLGNTDQARRLQFTGNQYDRYVAGEAKFLAGKTYTLVVVMKSNTGSSQSVQIGGYFPTGGGTTVTVTTSWARYVYTWTSGSDNYFNPGIGYMTAGTGVDILVESINIYEASSDPGAQPWDAGHCYFDTFLNDRFTTVSSGEISFPAGGRGFIQNPIATRPSGTDGYTVMAVMKRPSSLTGTDKHGTLIETANRDFNLTPEYENAGKPSITDGLFLQGTGCVEPDCGYDYIALGYQCVAMTWAANRADFYLGGRRIYAKAQNSSTRDLNNLWLGTYFGSANGFKYSQSACWATGITDEEDIATNSTVLTSRAVAAGVTMGSTPRPVYFEGHSWMAEDSDDPAWQVVNTLDTFSIAVSFASGGAQMVTLNDRLPYLLDCLRSGDVVVCMIGTNDFPTSGGNSGHTATFMTAFKAWCTAVMGSGAYLILETPCSRSNPFGSNTVDTAFNTTFRNPVRTEMLADFVDDGYCSAVIDSDAESYGGDTACSNAAIMDDGWHITHGSGYKTDRTNAIADAVNLAPVP
jgi:lysophospholipase L1-like esterase